MAVVPDIGASILAKLRNKARAVGIPYQQCLLLFFQEEFLRRLSYSKFAEHLILKGGLFIYVMTGYNSRPTVDVDFLLRRANGDLESIEAIVSEILSISTGNNKEVILTKTNVVAISPHHEYPGIRLKITGRIKNVRIPFDIDIGIGDIVIPNVQKRSMVPQIEGYTTPKIFTYSLESTISEKFDALLQRLQLTSRMKDLYDIFHLSRIFDFDGRSLCDALFLTLSKRGTPCGRDSLDLVVALADDPDMQLKWRYFTNKVGEHNLTLQEVITGIDRFIRPIWPALNDTLDLNCAWSAYSARWEEK